LRGGRRSSLLCTAAAGRPEAGPGALDKWSTDEDDAIDPGLWGDTKPATPLLDTIEYPVHLRHLKLPQLRQLCKEIREDLIHTVSKVSRLTKHSEHASCHAPFDNFSLHLCTISAPFISRVPL
jgi:hypothetical protein